jgi:hypothetical protein
MGGAIPTLPHSSSDVVLINHKNNFISPPPPSVIHSKHYSYSCYCYSKKPTFILTNPSTVMYYTIRSASSFSLNGHPSKLISEQKPSITQMGQYCIMFSNLGTTYIPSQATYQTVKQQIPNTERYSLQLPFKKSVVSFTIFNQ